MGSLNATVYNRLAADLVPTYAAGVWEGNIPPQHMPKADTLPVVVFGCSIEDQSTDDADDVNMVIEILTLTHVDADRDTMRTVEERIQGNADPGTDTPPTYGLHRWVPTVLGLGTSAFRRITAATGGRDDTHIAQTFQYGAYVSEG